ncbi:sugar-transfer associated ATP-grasp domain-containing protein [Aquibium microcysteis]|uniref:sugar-transfer associated ATP-grasp domain-containing protein n=1 Tax=Aquibium microcysteis TaxID=675281 RepID=UPI00165D0890|nr:sugar-transfer associated ATP-grasp domain-containing protein [Aquibium microcysteis]
MARVTTPAPIDLFVSFRHRPSTPLNWLRAARAAAVWRARPGLRRLPVVLRIGGWALRFVPDLVRHVWRNGGTWKRNMGRSHAQQVIDLVRAATGNALMPRDYYGCDMARHAGSATFFELFPYQLYATPVLALSAKEEVRLANDKLRLAARLTEGGVPTPEILAIVRNGTLLDGEGRPVDLPRRDVLFKPTGGMQGNGISIWRHGPSGTWTRGAESLREEALRQRLSREAGPRGAMLQEVLTNHASVRPFAPFALSSFRIVTVLDEHRVPEVVICQFRTATDAAGVVDNYHAGGCLFAIDIETGRFGVGHKGDFARRPQGIVSHPATGAAITGEVVPGLETSKALAARAHALLPTVICIGWDIALTEKGHVVLEANVPPGLQPSQQLAVGPRARRRFVELLGHHARAWLEATEPSRSRFLVGRSLED